MICNGSVAISPVHLRQQHLNYVYPAQYTKHVMGNTVPYNCCLSTSREWLLIMMYSRLTKVCFIEPVHKWAAAAVSVSLEVSAVAVAPYVI